MNKITYDCISTHIQHRVTWPALMKCELHWYAAVIQSKTCNLHVEFLKLSTTGWKMYMKHNVLARRSTKKHQAIKSVLNLFKVDVLTNRNRTFFWLLLFLDAFLTTSSPQLNLTGKNISLFHTFKSPLKIRQWQNIYCDIMKYFKFTYLLEKVLVLSFDWCGGELC